MAMFVYQRIIALNLSHVRIGKAFLVWGAAMRHPVQNVQPWEGTNFRDHPRSFRSPTLTKTALYPRFWCGFWPIPKKPSSRVPFSCAKAWIFQAIPTPHAVWFVSGEAQKATAAQFLVRMLLAQERRDHLLGRILVGVTRYDYDNLLMLLGMHGKPH